MLVVTLLVRPTLVIEQRFDRSVREKESDFFQI
jgi:hypothetical protein